MRQVWWFLTSEIGFLPLFLNDCYPAVFFFPQSSGVEDFSAALIKDVEDEHGPVADVALPPSTAEEDGTENVCKEEEEVNVFDVFDDRVVISYWWRASYICFCCVSIFFLVQRLFILIVLVVLYFLMDKFDCC